MDTDFPGRSADAGSGRDKRCEAAGDQRFAGDPEDPGAADFVWRCEAAAGGDWWAGHAGGVARITRRLTYHVGPGPAKVHLKMFSNWDIKPVYDVIAKIPGAQFPDEWVLRGNHHDAWVNGAEDPLSGRWR